MPHMEREPTNGRTGRWRSGEQSRRRILEAARDLFRVSSYEQVTVREVAREAGVDVAMVYYFFGNKDGLFTAALDLAAHPLGLLAEHLDRGLDDIGSRVVRAFLEHWDGGDVEPMLAVWHSAARHEQSKCLLKERLLAPVIERLERHGVDDAALRIELVVGHLMGVAFARYQLQLEPMASATHEQLVAWVGSTVHRYLTDPTPDPPPSPG